MTIEYKAVGVTELGDASDGRVRAIVAVTGVKDNVNDIIEPGAFTKSLKSRKPKGIWHHDWKESVSKTEAIKELMPGDPGLPKTLPDGRPWPKEAGALQVDMLFNMKTARGRDAYEDVKFFGPDAQWSIGYNVPSGKATKDSKGVRRIKEMELFEYSPVLHGAMPLAHTLSVKDAQAAFQEVKRLHGDEAEQFLLEVKNFMGDQWDEQRSPWSDDPEQDMHSGPETDDEDEDGDDNLDVADALQNAISGLHDLLQALVPSSAQEKAHGLAQMAYDAEFTESVEAKAAAFDVAIQTKDDASAQDLAISLMEDIEQGAEEGIDQKALTEMAEYISNGLKNLPKKPFPDDEDDDDDLFGDDDDDEIERDVDNDDSVDLADEDEDDEIKSIPLAELESALSDV